MKYYTFLFLLMLPSIGFTQNTTKLIDGYLKKGNEYSKIGEYDSAEYQYDKGIVLAKDINNCAKLFELYDERNYSIYVQKKFNDLIFDLKSLLSDYGDSLLLYPKFKASYLSYIAVCYYDLDDYVNSYVYYIQALDIQEKLGKNEGLAWDYGNIAFVLRKRGDLISSINYSLLSIQLANELNLDKDGVCSDYINIGIAYMHLKKFKEAELSFNKAWEFTKELSKKNKSSKQWLIEHQKGIMYYHEKRYDEAISLLQHPLAKRTATTPNLSNLRNQWATLSFVYCSWGKLDSARYYLNKEIEGIRLLKRFSNRQWGRTHRRFVDIYLKSHEYDSALHYAQKSLVNFLPLYDEQDIYSVPDLSYTSNEDQVRLTLYAKARAFLGLALQTKSPKDQEMTVKSFHVAVDMLDKMRSIYEAQGSKKQLAQRSWGIFEDAISAMLQLYKETKDPKYQAEAFYFLEKSKGIVLQDDLSDVSAKSQLSLPDSILEQEHALKVDIAYWENELLQAKKKKKAEKEAELQSKVFNLKQDLLRLTRQLEKDYPEYYQLKYSHEPITLAGLRDKLGSGEGVVEFFMGDSSVYVFYIDQNQFKTHEYKNSESIVQQIVDLREQVMPITNPAEYEPRFHAFQESSSKLYQDLLAPVLDGVQAKHLFIIPDGELGYLPFEMLLSDPTPLDVPDYRQLPYFIKQQEISYGFSASLLFNHPTSHQVATEGILAFGPSYPKAVTDSTRGADLGKFRSEVGELIWNQKEAQMVSSVLNGDYYVGADASEEKFKQSFSNYAVLHLAMHALVDDENPTHSRLVFSFNEDGTEDDYLHVYELYNMQLNAKLAVLSACNTGFGKLQRGEGVMSIGRAFAYAGCPSVTMSHWKVDDGATAELMEGFYTGLANGLTKSAAMRQAQLQYIQKAGPRNAAPFYWASFMVLGDNEPVVSSSTWYYWVTGILLIALIIAVIKRWK